MAYDTVVVTDFEALKTEVESLYARGILSHKSELTNKTIFTGGVSAGVGVVTDTVYTSGFVAGQSTFIDTRGTFVTAGVQAGDKLVGKAKNGQFDVRYTVKTVDSETQLTLDVNTPVAYTVLSTEDTANKTYTITTPSYECELDAIENAFTTLSLSLLSINNQS